MGTTEQPEWCPRCPWKGTTDPNIGEDPRHWECLPSMKTRKSSRLQKKIQVYLKWSQATFLNKVIWAKICFQGKKARNLGHQTNKKKRKVQLSQPFLALFNYSNHFSSLARVMSANASHSIYAKVSFPYCSPLGGLPTFLHLDSKNFP